MIAPNFLTNLTILTIAWTGRKAAPDIDLTSLTSLTSKKRYPKADFTKARLQA